MLSLDDRKWSLFVVGKLFSVTRPNSRTKDSYEKGDIPFIASGSMNNGAAKYCTPAKGEKLDKAGCITVSPVDGSCFYQPVDFLGRGGGGSSILLLRSNRMTRNSGQFVARALEQTLKAKYTYGRMGNSKTIEREKFMLPVDDTEEPDWEFMEDYVREREAAQVERCREFLARRLEEIERERVTEPVIPLDEKKWRVFDAFGVKGLLSIKATSSGVDAVRLVNGSPSSYPYVTRSAVNNGIAQFVSPDNMKYGYDRAGAITVGLDTQTAFLQPCDFMTGQNIQIVTADVLNEDVAMFLLPVLKSQMRAKFNWGGNGATLGRMKRLQIMLPVNESNEPDWNYMAAYVRSKKVEQCRREIGFLDNKRNLVKDGRPLLTR